MLQMLHCGLRAYQANVGKALPWEDPGIKRAGWSAESGLRGKTMELTPPHSLPRLYTCAGQIIHHIQTYQNIVFRTYKTLRYSKEGFNFLPMIAVSTVASGEKKKTKDSTSNQLLETSL